LAPSSFQMTGINLSIIPGATRAFGEGSSARLGHLRFNKA
jgi:hypothetical protein